MSTPQITGEKATLAGLLNRLLPNQLSGELCVVDIN